MARHTSCFLSTENLLHNLAVIKTKAPDAKIMGMVKANAYGHGLRSVSQRLDGHVDALGVASIDEALALRQAGVMAPIVLIEGVFTGDELLCASEKGFQVVFHTAAQLNWLSEITLPKPLAAWIKIYTGMGRLGFQPDTVNEAMTLLTNSSSIQKPIGIMTHFACADEPSHPLNGEQINAFQAFVRARPEPKSICNSAGLFAFPSQHYDWVRPGVALYGISPFLNETGKSLGLKQVMTFSTRLIAVQDLKKGATIGYGARYVCSENMPVGIMAVGYGDGYPRTAQDGTPVLVNGERCPLAGRVSMDMAAIDLRHCQAAKAGDPVILWGEDLSIEEVARTTNSIPYDLVCGVQNRVRFHWSKADEAPFEASLKSA